MTITLRNTHNQPNRHPTTGVRYTIYHINNELHPDVWDDIYRGTSLDYAEFEADCRARAARQLEDVQSMLEIELRPSDYEAMLDTLYEAMLEQHTFEPDEECYEGETDGIKWRTTWLGGAPHLIVLESPYYGCGLQCSPCVPGAVNGSTILSIWRDEAAAAANAADGDYGYCLPGTWLRGAND